MKPGKLDAAHLQAIHKSIFQDVYPWAGKFRTVDIARSGQFYFAFAAQIVPALEIMFGELRKEQHLGDLDTAQFCKRAAFYIGELNAIHPFCDGNRRTQCEFIRQLALRNRCLFIGRALREIRCTMHLIVVFCTGLMPGLKKFFCPRLPELGIVD